MSIVDASNTQPLPLTYEPMGPSHADRIWAAVAILFAGLALVVLGGCFLIGIMASEEMYPGTPISLITSPKLLVGILYFLTFACLLPATILLFRGAITLIRILNIPTPPSVAGERPTPADVARPH